MNMNDFWKLKERGEEKEILDVVSNRDSSIVRVRTFHDPETKKTYQASKAASVYRVADDGDDSDGEWILMK